MITHYWRWRRLGWHLTLPVDCVLPHPGSSIGHLVRYQTTALETARLLPRRLGSQALSFLVESGKFCNLPWGTSLGGGGAAAASTLWPAVCRQGYSQQQRPAPMTGTSMGTFQRAAARTEFFLQVRIST